MPKRAMKMNQALKEIGLKGLILKKIESNIIDLEASASGVDMIRPPMGDDRKQIDFVKSRKQAVTDLISDYEEIKERVEKTNLSCQLTINGITKTVTGWRAWMQMLRPVHAKMIRAHNLTAGERMINGRSAAFNLAKDAKAPAAIPYYDPEVIIKERQDIENLYEEVKARIETFNATQDLME